MRTLRRCNRKGITELYIIRMLGVQIPTMLQPFKSSRQESIIGFLGVRDYILPLLSIKVVYASMYVEDG